MRNVNKVPPKQWRKWSEPARGVFNDVYGGMRDSQSVMSPKAPPLKPTHWKTLAWNVAWNAASAVDNVLADLASDIIA